MRFLAAHRPVLFAGLALAVLTALGLNVAASQRHEHARLAEDFADRAELAGRLTSGALQNKRGENATVAEQTLGGDARSVRAAVRTSADDDHVAVLGLHGEVLAGAPVTHATEVGFARQGFLGYSDLVGDGGEPSLRVAVAFDSSRGRRIWDFAVPARLVTEFATAYLTSALAVDRGQASLVDGNGRIIASTTSARLGDDASGLKRNGNETFYRRGDAFVAVAPVTGTRWRLVFQAPVSSVYAPVASATQRGWWLFGGLVVVVLALIAAGRQALGQAARLAHERQHDPLTGLPNRGLFADRTTDALDHLRRNGGSAAALFVDLDAFKPVNDRYGHATGDALLALVAERLKHQVRPHDLVSRFGGDEFVVLCCPLSDLDDAIVVARRIQTALAQPFHVDGAELHIGCSIGIASLRVPPDPADGTALIRQADHAMYQAKRQAPGTIATYSVGSGAVGNASVIS